MEYAKTEHGHEIRRYDASEQEYLLGLKHKELKALVYALRLGGSHFRAHGSATEFVTALITGTAPAMAGHAGGPVEPVPAPAPAPAEVADTARQIAEILAKAGSGGLNASQVQSMIDAAIADIGHARPVDIRIDGLPTPVQGEPAHSMLPDLIKFMAIRRAGGILNPFLVGPAGSGKTTACEQAAKALGLEFFFTSVCAQTSKSDLVGYRDATGNYIRTPLRDAYEFGGVFLLDEIDAGNANVLVVLNALASGASYTFPDRKVDRHKDFILCAAANTYGLGANSVYIGRCKLDESTRNRFRPMEWGYDEAFEATLTGTDAIGKAWLAKIRKLRVKADELKLEKVISPRQSIGGAQMLRAGYPEEQVLKDLIWSGLSENTVEQLKGAL